jgi:cobalt/nickel transport system permease protein
MHMADALISPAVGGAGWAATLGLAGYCARKLKLAANDSLVPLMGVGAAFVFAAQSINFSIPGTGSSGHLGGGLLLAALLGPHAAFLAMASILTVQALFFADGGLLALGCNLFNLGFFPCLIAFPLLFRPIAGPNPSRTRLAGASLVAAIAGLQLGALGVVLETRLAGVAELPMGTFLLFMQPIHLAIGIVEGLATAAVLLFVRQARPDALQLVSRVPAAPRSTNRRLVGALLVVALVLVALVSWFASQSPDGLEWSIARSSGEPGLAVGAAEWPAVDAGTSLAGLLGVALTLLFAGLIGVGVRRRGAARV